MTTAQTVCEPRSRASVLQQPSRYQPVMGSSEQLSSGRPKTLSDAFMGYFPIGEHDTESTTGGLGLKVGAPGTRKALAFGESRSSVPP